MELVVSENFVPTVRSSRFYTSVLRFWNPKIIKSHRLMLRDRRADKLAAE